jgi:heme-degrading monooxygenase HmoA
MSELVTSGVWQVRPGSESEFTEEWSRFARWAATMPGATAFRLACDGADPQRYVSFAAWTDGAAAHAWKQSPEFRERIAQVLQYVQHFQPAELSVVATVEATAGVGTN